MKNGERKNKNKIMKIFNTFCSLTARQTYKIFTEWIIIYQMNLEQNQTSILKSSQEIDVSIFLHFVKRLTEFTDGQILVVKKKEICIINYLSCFIY